MLNSILFLIFYVNGLMMHDFHASICEIEFDEKRKALEVTQRIFLDDLEETLRQWSGNPKVDVTNPDDKKQFQELLNKYLLSNLVIKVNDKPVNMSYLGSEIEDNAMYCYIDIPGIKKIKSIEVKNTVLIEMFDDQTNIVHVTIQDETKSLKLDRLKPIGTISY